MTPFEPFPDVPTLQSALVNDFCALARRCVEANGTFNVSLSGGSTPKVVYERLRDEDLPWASIHWFWGDERNVPHDHEDSNCRMVHQALLDHVPVPSGNVHPVPVQVNDPAAAALEYDQTLREHFAGQLPSWDLVLLGMGDDAHTASLFPETQALQCTDRLFVENWVPKFDAFRYTLCADAINSGQNIWFVITGSAKQAAMRQVLSTNHQPHLYPSQLIKPTQWYVSADAVPA
ncbi:6-phosphogluconolactonase [Stieleria varia]|uniref:6-phosphogluconolactonase n=1 Tax=Stieleria varia TaxID=2528005 RepID=A0A5C6ASG6_9BACT|nr:6-phosphogluconolactonase [Stieleria varia]TWU02630.1 6-phosphogluconolactonase [Stieleria varia]